MRKTGLALCCLALTASVAVDVWAGGRGGGHSSGARGGGAHHFHHGARARVFISSPFFFAPRPYYYYPAPVFAPPVEYIQQEPAESQYWYYCPASGAYYPYVKDCSGGWQLVQPQAEVQPSFPG
jgi:hypothetical protein